MGRERRNKMTVNNIGKTISNGAVQGAYPYKSRGNQKFDEDFFAGKTAGERETMEEKSAAGLKGERKRAGAYQTKIGSGFGELAVSNTKILAENCVPEQAAVCACRVRHISGAESDYAKVCVVEGYSLKAKAFREAGNVYLEQKAEDGSIQAYEADMKRIREGTQDVLEQAALLAWRNAEESPQGESADFHEAMLAFYEKVEEQIRKGAPKFQIGGSEFSQRAWRELIEEIDTCLGEMREERSVSSELIEKLLEDRDAENSRRGEEI